MKLHPKLKYTMIFPIFILLNLCFTLLFFYLIYRAAILLKKEIGVWAVVIFIIGLLSKNNRYSTQNTNKFAFNKHKTFIKGSEKVKYIALEHDFVSGTGLVLSYAIDSASKTYFPTEATATNTGLGSQNLEWYPSDILIYPSSNPKQLRYFIRGSRKTSFLLLINYAGTTNHRGKFDL